MTAMLHGRCANIALLAIAMLVAAAFRPVLGLAQAAPPRRVAVVVGANAAAPGRRALRYAHDDATAFAAVLREVAGFAPDDVRVLLDPDPHEVLAQLDGELALLAQKPGESVLLFYYSGHADAGALYPHGRELPLDALRTRLDDRRAGVRIGLIDACRGGGWTGTKGLTETEPFPVGAPLALSSEGSVLIASSSGLEDAHESEALGGSFFTHHWNAGLRGAADRDRDERISVGEAFDYAKAHTVHDTALHTAAAQHPSFSMQLRGRQDLVLAMLSTGTTVLSLAQETGPLSLIHLETGVVMLELPRGARRMRLLVAPGRYLLRRSAGGKVWAKEIEVRAGQTTHVSEGSLELLGDSHLVVKRAEPRPLTRTTLPAHQQELTFSMGVSYEPYGAIKSLQVRPDGLRVGTQRDFVTGFIAPRGLTDRWQWGLPGLGFAYRGGEHAHFEWVPWGGLVGVGIGGSSTNGLMLQANPGLGLDLRFWTSARSSIDLGSGVISGMGVQTKDELATDLAREANHWHPPITWRAQLSLGYTHTIADTVTFHFSTKLTENALHDGDWASYGLRSRESDRVLAFGSVQAMGLRPQPLLRVHVRDWFAINVNVAVAYSFVQRKTYESYTVGASFVW